MVVFDRGTGYRAGGERGMTTTGVVLTGLLGVLLAACAKTPAPPAAVTLGNRDDDTPKVVVDRTSDSPAVDVGSSTYWPAASLESGTARISCGYDYETEGDGEVLSGLGYFSLVDALAACRAAGVVRVRYEGKIGAGFTALVERVAAMANRMDIPTRILDVSSTGGHVEEAIRAGDAMADSHWSIWVRDGSICHSACVLVLAAGDTRSIVGKVGIHRLIRDNSQARTRAELRAELKQIHGDVTEYLERNGGAATIADLMMTVPNRDLRLLTDAELKEYGLDGTNAAQADLDRIVVMRKCGEDFVRRRDAYTRAFDRLCLEPGRAFKTADECGQSLQQRYGFPDSHCPAESPVAVLTPDRKALPAGAGVSGQ